MEFRNLVFDAPCIEEDGWHELSSSRLSRFLDQLREVPDKPKQEESQLMRMLWWIESKTALRSRETSIVADPESAA